MNIEYKYNDIQGVNEIYRSLNKQDRVFVRGGDKKNLNKNYLIDRKEFSPKHSHIVTMYMDGKPVAYCSWDRARDEKTNQYNDECYIDFAVHSDYRGRGIAKKILKHSMDIIKRDPSYKTIKWYCLSENKASNALAKKYGFKWFENRRADNDDTIHGYQYKK